MHTHEVSRPRSLMDRLNGEHHRIAVNTYMVIVIAHWMEHLGQAFQIWVLGWPVSKSLGALGLVFPSLVKSEALHYGYALIMLVGLHILRRGFVGRSHVWWITAFGIQFWHHLEHLLLFIQAQLGQPFFGASAPVSIAQLVIPRVELHLFYNTVVFVPMAVAVYLHLRPHESERSAAVCACAGRAVSTNAA